MCWVGSHVSISSSSPPFSEYLLEASDERIFEDIVEERDILKDLSGQ